MVKNIFDIAYVNWRCIDGLHNQTTYSSDNNQIRSFGYVDMLLSSFFNRTLVDCYPYLGVNKLQIDSGLLCLSTA
jgi:hypothetical protein